jgi:hypothetical protein
MPSLKQHVGQVVRRRYLVAASFFAVACILSWPSYQRLAPRMDWMPDDQERPGLAHFITPLLALGFLVGSIVALVWAMRLPGHPNRHPVLMRLAVYGPPEEVLAEIDSELAQTDDLVTLGRPVKSFRVAMPGDGSIAYLTRNWLVQFTDLGVRLARLDDVLWAWKSVVGWSDDVFTTRVHNVRLLVRRGQHVEMVLAEIEVGRLLLWLLRRAPWIRVGYDPRLPELWLMKPGQLGELLGEVESDRQRLERQTPAERETAIQARTEDLMRAETAHRDQKR